jgi:hypothetical protein
MSVLASLLDVVQIAHDIGVPHQETMKSNGGGTSVIVIVAGVLVSLVAVAGLIWWKRRVDD